MIDDLRAQIRAALRSGDMDRAWMLVRVVVGLRVCSGEINVALKPPQL